MNIFNRKPKTKVTIFKFDPKHDITSYELALCVKALLAKDADLLPLHIKDKHFKREEVEKTVK